MYSFYLFTIQPSAVVWGVFNENFAVLHISLKLPPL